jgi:hypothetical protein
MRKSVELHNLPEHEGTAFFAKYRLLPIVWSPTRL